MTDFFGDPLEDALVTGESDARVLDTLAAMEGTGLVALVRKAPTEKESSDNQGG